MENPVSKLPRRFKSRRRWTAAQARAALFALQESGLSLAAFAKREGIEPKRLYNWQARLRSGVARTEKPDFVEVISRATEPLEIVLSNGHVVRIPPSFDAAALRRLLEILSQAKC